MKRAVSCLASAFFLLCLTQVAYSDMPNPCPSPLPPDIKSCYKVSLNYMGSFSTTGEWDYNPTYLEEMSHWGRSNASACQVLWTPRKTLASSVPGSSPTLQVTFRGDGSRYTRFDLETPIKEVILYPEVYRIESYQPPPGGTYTVAFVANFVQDPTCTRLDCGPCTPDPCCSPPTVPAFTQKQDAGTTIDPTYVTSIHWEEKGETVTPTRTSESRLPVNYNFNAAFEQSPMYGNYNFWQYPSGPSTPDFVNSNRIYGYFRAGVIPDSNTPSTIELLNGSGTLGKLYFSGGDTATVPPIVTADSIGKKSKPKSLVVEEIDGQLVIQWEAQRILSPYTQLGLYVGQWYDPPVMPDGIKYAPLNAPSQMGMAVVPAKHWSILKPALGNKAYISINYRRHYIHTSGTVLQVRGVSDLAEFPIP